MIDRELNIVKAEALLDDLIDSDPDRAERFIESRLAQLALKKRASERAKQAEPPSDSEMAALDAVIYGGSVTLDGKRIDPTSAYAPPADDEVPMLWAKHLWPVSDLLCQWKTGVKDGNTVVAELFKFFSSTPSVRCPPPADDEAVRLLREARERAGLELRIAIDAYLAKVTK